MPLVNPSTGGGAAAASQAEMEAASSTTVYASPGRTQYHPGVAKAWVKVTWSGGTPTAAASLNVASLTDNTTGDVTINFTTAFSSADYAVAAIAQRSVANDPMMASPKQGVAPTASALRIVTFNGGFVNEDAALLGVTCHGDQ